MKCKWSKFQSLTGIFDQREMYRYICTMHKWYERHEKTKTKNISYLVVMLVINYDIVEIEVNNPLYRLSVK